MTTDDQRGGAAEDGRAPEDEGFETMSTTCPRCGDRLRAIDLDSGAVVLRCPTCGLTAI